MLINGYCRDCLLKELAKVDVEVKNARKLREEIEREYLVGNTKYIEWVDKLSREIDAFVVALILALLLLIGSGVFF